MEHGEEKLQRELDEVRERERLALQKEVSDLKRMIVGDGTNPGLAHTVMEMSKDMYVGPNCLMENTRELREFKIKMLGYVSGVVGFIIAADKLLSHLLK